MLVAFKPGAGEACFRLRRQAAGNSVSVDFGRGDGDGGRGGVLMVYCNLGGRTARHTIPDDQVAKQDHQITLEWRDAVADDTAI